MEWRDVLGGLALFFSFILLVGFGTKVIGDSQVGMVNGSLELNETDDWLNTINVVFSVFFNPLGFLVGVLVIVGTLIIGFGVISGMRAGR